jgi:hypothetical protein
MKKQLQMISVFMLCLILQTENLAAFSVIRAKTPNRFQGFLGAYHPFKGTAYGGEGWEEGVPMQSAFHFGENAIISQRSYNGYTFAENIENNCRDWDVNKIYGILRPPTEKGRINHPEDTALMDPLLIEPGMVQGAHRFSELSKSCPQITGVIVDDFFNDYPNLMSAEDLLDIRDAVKGKVLRVDGTIDHTSVATTPELKLYAVVYDHQLGRADKSVLDLIDGVSFWIWKQNDNHQKYADYVSKLQASFPQKEIIPGVYVFNGVETPSPASVHGVISKTIELYEKGELNGLLMFSAIWLSREKSTRKRWEELDLPRFLGKIYYPFLGEARGRVIDTKSKKPVKNALVTVERVVGKRRTLVTRKFTGPEGEYRFGGWVGKNARGNNFFEIAIDRAGFSRYTKRIKLRADDSVVLSDIALKR